MEKEIILSVKNELDYLKEKDYWEDINSFCLYTDEDFMSLSLVFNTNSFYMSVSDSEYPLTYKFMPSEWFSETLKKDQDEILYNNTFFKNIEKILAANALDENISNKDLLDDLISAMKYCISHHIFPNKDTNIYLVMKSDNFEAEEILRDNNGFNHQDINSQLKEFVENEL